MFQKLHIKSADFVKETILKNGPKIVSFENNKMMSSITFGFRNVGISYETPPLSSKTPTLGFTKILEELMFEGSGNYNYSDFYNNEFHFDALLDYESYRFFVQFPRKKLDKAVDMITDGVFNCVELIQNEEFVRNIIERNEIVYNECYTNPCNSLKEPFEDVLLDKIHESCFSLRQGLGNPQLHHCNIEGSNFSNERLLEYYKDNISLSNLVVTAIGVDHDEVVEKVEKCLEPYAHCVNEEKGGPNILLGNAWVGEMCKKEFLHNPFESSKQDMPPVSSMAISFPASNFYSKDYYSWYVLQELLGGGFAFAAGGPGKGLSSIICENYLTKFPFENMQAYYSPFQEIGFFTIHASCVHEYASHLPEVITHCYANVFDNLQEYDVDAAKNRYKSKIFRALEDTGVLHELLNFNSLFYENFETSSNYIFERINSITMNDLKDVLCKALQSPPAVTAMGSIDDVPDKDIFDNVYKDIACSM